MSDDLVKRLESVDERCIAKCPGCADSLEAADAIERLEAENQRLRDGHEAFAAFLLSLAYPEHDPADYADHATGVADLVPLFNPWSVIDRDFFGYKRALIIGPPYTTGVDDE